MPKHRIVMLGHGEIGRALESVMKENAEISIWERDLKSWEENVPLESLFDRDCALVLFALPANPHRELAERVHKVAPPESVCLTIAKGLDDEGNTPAAVFDSIFGDKRHFGVLYGPMISEDILADKPGFASVVSKSNEVIVLAQTLFSNSNLHMNSSQDVVGASWAVILKNIYVPLIGAAEQLELGANMRGFLICAAMGELSRIVQQFGGSRETVYDLPGIGDLVTTATSVGSHHRNAGMQLARGDTGSLQASGANIRGEGFHALRMLAEHDLVNFTDFPLLSAMRELLDHPGNARQILSDLCDASDVIR